MSFCSEIRKELVAKLEDSS